MTKIRSHYEDKKVEVIVFTSLIVSIIISSFFILFSTDQNIRDYNALLMSAISIGVALIICLVQVFRYKKSIIIQGITQSRPSEKSNINRIQVRPDGSSPHEHFIKNFKS